MSKGTRPSDRGSACAELGFTIPCDGLRLRAKSITPPGTALTGPGPSLVFLHEGLGSIGQWRGFPLALAQATGLPALVYDRAGYGKSDDPRDPPDPSYLEREAWERLPRVLSACGIEAPILVGHSDGASIALLYASSGPGALLGVVAEAAHVFVEDLTIQGIWRTLHAFETTSLRERLKAHHGDRVDQVFRRWSDLWLSPAFRPWTMIHHLPGIRCPVLAIQGADDEYGTPDQIAAITQGVSGPVQGMVLGGCAHVPHLQAKERVLAEITRFVEGIRGQEQGRV